MTDVDTAAVKELIERYHQVFSSGDVEAVLGLWDRDGVVFEPGSPAAQGPNELRNAYERGYAGADYHFDCAVDDVTVQGNLAAARSHAVGQVWVKPTGAVIPVRARQLFTARRTDAQWKLVHYMFQEDPEGAD